MKQSKKTIDKFLYTYWLAKLHYHLRHQVGATEAVYYWKPNSARPDYKLVIIGSRARLTLRINITEQFKAPTESVLQCQQPRPFWVIQCVDESFMLALINKLLFYPQPYKETKPIPCYIGCSPAEIKQRDKKRKQGIKYLFKSMEHCVINQKLSEETAAAQFSASTGCRYARSLSYFSQVCFSQVNN